MKNIAEKLVSGSNEITRMQTDVHKLVKMLTSAVYEQEMHDLVPNNTFREREMSSGSKWRLSRESADGLVVICSLKTYSGHCMSYSSTDRVFLIPAVTQATYDTLPEFVDWMFKLFPQLKYRLQPFLDAAAAKEARGV